MSPPKDKPAFKRLDNPEVDKIEIRDFYDEGSHAVRMRKDRSLPTTKNPISNQVSVKNYEPYTKASEKQTASTNSSSGNQDSPAAIAIGDNKLRYQSSDEPVRMLKFSTSMDYTPRRQEPFDRKMVENMDGALASVEDVIDMNG